MQRGAVEDDFVDPRLKERRRLEMRFALEWARLRQLVTEQLSREARILTPGPRREVRAIKVQMRGREIEPGSE